MKGTLFIVDAFEVRVDVVMHRSSSVTPFFCSRRGEFVIVIAVHGVWIKAMQASV